MTEPTIPFPASPYCRVRARVASIWADGPDDGTHPDWRPAAGERVTLTPSIGSQLLTYDTAGPNPIIVTVERVECVVDEDGWLAKSDGRPVYIAPTDDPLMSATGWTWTASIKGKSIAFSAPAGGVVDLALYVATPAVDAVEYVSVVQIVADYITANPPDVEQAVEDYLTANPPAAVSDATTATKGIVELATTAETTAGTDTTRAVTPAGVAAAIAGVTGGGGGGGVELVAGAVTLGSSGTPIREFYATGSVTINGVTFPAGTAVVFRRDTTDAWAYKVVDDWTAITLPEATPLAPTFTDPSGTAGDEYTIPAVAGVIYKVDGVTTAAGTYPGSGTVTVTAEAASGYTLVGTSSWTHTFSTATDPIEVTATAPTWTDDTINGGGTWTTPTIAGVTYSPASGTATAGESVTVSATADSGYTLTGTTSWTHVFPVAGGGGAVFFTDFSTDTEDQAPAGWTERWASGINATIVSDSAALSGKAMSVHPPTQARRSLSWDLAGAPSGTVEIVTRFYTPVAPTQSEADHLLRVNIGGAEGTESAVSLLSRGDKIEASYYNGGTPSGAGTPSADATHAANQWYWARLRREGGNRRARFWSDGEPEPAEWAINSSQSGMPPEVGHIGVGAYNARQVIYDRIGVAIGGGTAPTEVP